MTQTQRYRARQIQIRSSRAPWSRNRERVTRKPPSRKVRSGLLWEWVAWFQP